MFRAAVFSIVLSLAASQSAGILCGFWCEPHNPIAAGCEHKHPASRAPLIAKDGCSEVAIGVAFVRNEERRAGADAYAVIPVFLSQFNPHIPYQRAAQDVVLTPASNAPLLVIALRI